MRDTVDRKYLKYLFKGSLAININTQYIFSIFNYKYVDIFELKINLHYSLAVSIVSVSKAKSVKKYRVRFTILACALFVLLIFQWCSYWFPVSLQRNINIISEAGDLLCCEMWRHNKCHFISLEHFMLDNSCVLCCWCSCRHVLYYILCLCVRGHKYLNKN